MVRETQQWAHRPVNEAPPGGDTLTPFHNQAFPSSPFWRSNVATLWVYCCGFIVVILWLFGGYFVTFIPPRWRVLLSHS